MFEDMHLSGLENLLHLLPMRGDERIEAGAELVRHQRGRVRQRCGVSNALVVNPHTWNYDPDFLEVGTCRSPRAAASPVRRPACPLGHPPTTRPLTPSLRPAVGTAPASRSAEVRSGQKPLPVGGPLQSRLSGSASPDFSIGLPGGLGWRACRTPTYTMSAAATRTTMTVPHIGTSDNLGAFSSPSPVIPRVAGVVTLTPGRSTLPGSRGNRICRIGGKTAANERKPALRELGFKGSGRVYVLPDGRWEGSVGGSEARQRASHL